MGVAMVLSDICSKAAVSQHSVAMMNDQISLYVNMTGACERILKTAIPVAYSRCAPEARALAT
jgi:predicted membrane chloride channel (bestrophin family)